ncbi:DNA mismatch endonuclease Vsr [Microbispora triticiradicis]|nr:DNA mismatch endonuclease Vsr [Microbispora triticiradicis]
MTAEQDRAAGGHHLRYKDLGDGRRSCASVVLRLPPKNRRIRAYLRWSDKGRYPEKYIGEVDRDTREENLALAWRMALERGLLAAESDNCGGAGDTNESWASTPAVRAVMRGNRSRDTRPERALRSAAHALGLRYRVGIRPLPEIRRTADLVFTKAKVAVFLDGCYWHGCEEHYRPSQKNAEFWSSKIATNRSRDQETDRLLRDAGWETIRIWEHEDVTDAAARVAEVVRHKRRSRSL